WGGWQGGDADAHKRYLGLLVDTATRLLERGDRVLLLVGQPVDVPVAEEVRQRILQAVPSSVTAVEVAHSGTFEDLCASVDATDLVIAARFHTIVAGVMRGRAVISIGYAPKNRELLAALGIVGADQEIHRAIVPWLLERIDAVTAGEQQQPGAVMEVIAGWQDLTREELRSLAGALAAGRVGRTRR
ncbi:MAG: hypothetical protein L0H31_13925, partial [Nocardioidaceae bacterium]|nr:hypothetical protein [Nocardioidaceae bacterium]